MLEPAICAALAADDQHIAVVGASGWIGLATLELLEHAFGDRIAQRVSCYGSAARALTLRSGRVLPQVPLAELKMLDARRIWLLHFAFRTKDRAETMDEESYRAVNDAISTTVLEAATKLPIEAMFVASSGAASKAVDPLASPAMRLYGQMKLNDEARFANWAHAYGRRVVICRIFNITGPYINKHQAYAIANFIMDALADRPITVRATRKVFRGYVAIRELMSLVFALMADQDTPVAHFESGGEPMELATVAHLVAQALASGSVERAPITDPATDCYVGDDERYAALCRTHSIRSVPLVRQIMETAEYMRALPT